MIVEHLGYLQGVIDKRSNIEYTSATFECSDVQCLEYFNHHKYVFNVDS